MGVGADFSLARGCPVSEGGSLLFAHAEGCVARGDTAERNRFVTRLRQAATKLADAGYESLV